MNILKKITPLLVTLLATACNVNNGSATKKAEYTVLFYMCGSNLESDYANKTKISYGGYTYSWNGQGLATMDIREILRVKDKPSDVNILIETGGARSWTNSKYGKYGDYDIDAKKLQIHRVNNKQQLVLEKSFDYKSMGKADTLQTFLEYGLKKYPAKRTALVLWNHGGGLQGVCFDEKKSDDSLTATEVANAVAGALKNCNMEGQKLDWIGYDACLMGVQDIAEINSHYFNYMVASQQLESGYGWKYNKWIDDLYEKKSTPEILQEICDTFVASNNDLGDQNDQTLAYYDLSKASTYLNAWNDFTEQISQVIPNTSKKQFNNIVGSSKTFGDDAAYAYGLVDVKDFINKLSGYEAYSSAVDFDSINAAFDEFVVYSKIGVGAGNANGLSMYFTISEYTSYYNSYSHYDTNFTSWSDFVATYGY